MLLDTVTIIFIGILIYYALLAIWYTTLFILSFPTVIQKFKQSKFNNIIEFINEDKIIPITVVTPAFNESKRIINMAYAVLQSDYKNVDFIIVNDGSTDSMMELLTHEFMLYEIPPTVKQIIPTSPVKRYLKSKRFENILVIDKEHSPYNNAADSVNAGLNACKTPIMVTIDADTILEPPALSQLLFAFLSRTHCVTVGGSVYVLNENRVEHGRLLETNIPKNFVSAVQSVEYLRSFLYGRAGLNYFGGAMSFPGAFTLFETRVLFEVGGFDTQILLMTVKLSQKFITG
jgi:biofilm PGA synthesis N-glycosyltransferase PgaC